MCSGELTIFACARSVCSAPSPCWRFVLWGTVIVLSASADDCSPLNSNLTGYRTLQNAHFIQGFLLECDQV